MSILLFSCFLIVILADAWLLFDGSVAKNARVAAAKAGLLAVFPLYYQPDQRRVVRPPGQRRASVPPFVWGLGRLA
jgi:hypothetical protein